MPKSIEEQVEDWGKKQLKKTKYYTKTEIINPEIEKALKIAPSKKGGNGSNFPDIKLFIQTKSLRKIPVMVEVKGKKGALIKVNASNEIDNIKKDGSPNFTNINKYAVNGAIHYANAIINNSITYKEAIAVGLNGYDEPGGRIYEIETYYISRDNYCIPKRLKTYEDLSFLLPGNIDKLIDEIDNSYLTDEELEAKAKEFENEIEIKLKKLNQVMQDDLKISVGSRVELVTGMIMASLGVAGKVAPLEIADLKGEMGSKSNDGQVIINKIDSFLEERNLPYEKKAMIINDLSRVFIYSDLWKTVNGESKLKTVYTSVKNDIMPIFTSARHLDFTGRLFNVLNAWVDIPDSDKNDVVLTPRYVTDLMAKLAKVNKDSYVWDYATGSAGFLISSMKLMIKDAENKIKSPKKLNEKITKIKCEQLLGIEKRSDIYLLAVLNMILMGDGSSNIIHKDSLTEYTGVYEQGILKDKIYPANVFLLNPPYSAQGKGFVFVEKALNKMNNGMDRGASRRKKLSQLFGENPYVSAFYAPHTLEVDFVSEESNKDFVCSVIRNTYKDATVIERHVSTIKSGTEAERYDSVMTVANNIKKGWYATLLAETIDARAVIPMYILDAIVFAAKDILSEKLLWKMVQYSFEQYLPDSDFDDLKAAFKEAKSSKEIQTTIKEFCAEFPEDMVSLFIAKAGGLNV